MCGITGLLKLQQPISESEIRGMTDRLQRRGPDADGFFLKDNIALGHRRLSVIDLESGDQPMYSNDGNIVIVFNGEIYNFLDLKKELQSSGHQFKTTSDTEVVIATYQHFGIKGLLEKLEGMFAFALFDQKEGKLFIARDKFGEKPLYYISDSTQFAFASELKALEGVIPNQEIDLNGLNLFLSLTYIPAPFTIYKSVKKLEAGHYLELDLTGKIHDFKYYDLRERLKKQHPITNFEEAKEKVKSLLYKSVKQRMVSDVPLGSFLSGGIDSSIISAVMSDISKEPVNTFSIGFNEKSYDESERAQIVADKIKANHTVHFLDYKDVVEMVDDIVLHFDEPFGDSSALPSFYVAKLAREKVTVVLTGDCADELFGGYEKYLGYYYSSKFKSQPAFVRNAIKRLVKIIPHTRFTNSLLRRAKKVLDNSNLSGFDMHYNLMCLGFSDNDREEILRDKFFQNVKPFIQKRYQGYEEGNDLEKGFYTDLRYVLEGDMLTKVDRVCMQNSLEARVPFLDSEMVELAYRLPLEFKIKGRNKKYILKETFKHLLPSETIGFRKKGFGVPVDYWFQNELKEELTQLLAKDFIEEQGLFKFNYVNQLLNEHLSGKENHKGKLWNLYVFQKWYLAKGIKTKAVRSKVEPL